MVSGIAIEGLFVSDKAPLNQVRESASAVFTDCWSNVRPSAFPGFTAIDFYPHTDVTHEIDALEKLLGVRPLLESEVEQLFDPVTGARL